MWGPQQAGVIYALLPQVCLGTCSPAACWKCRTLGTWGAGSPRGLVTSPVLSLGGGQLFSWLHSPRGDAHLSRLHLQVESEVSVCRLPLTGA